MDHNNRAGLQRVAENPGLPFGVLEGSDQSWTQHLEFDCTPKLRGKHPVILWSLLLEAARPSPVSPQSASYLRDREVSKPFPKMCIQVFFWGGSVIQLCPALSPSESNPIISVLSKQKIGKNSGKGTEQVLISPFRVAGSLRLSLCYVPPGSVSAALGLSPVPSPHAGASWPPPV